MHYVWMFIVGLIVGAIARFLMPGNAGLSWFMTGLLGIAGSFIGGFISRLFNKTPGAKFGPSGFLMSIVGALVLLFIWGKMAH